MDSIYRKRESGLSLLELLLVLAIAGVLIVMGIRQYQILKIDADSRQVQANVDTLFQAAVKFYQAECDQKIGAYNNLGYLNPNTGISPDSPTSITMDLLKPYLATTTFPDNSIVAGTDYTVQFVPHTSERKVTVDTGTGSTEEKTIGTILIWSIQVIVKLRDSSKADLYFRLLRGDCLVPSATTTGSCTGPGTGGYVVFERLPSFAANQNETPYWLMNPLVKQFKQMYTTYPVQYLINTGGETPTGERQYFLCGG